MLQSYKIIRIFAHKIATFLLIIKNLRIMDYKIIDIEGVGDVYAEKLVAAGINKVSELLEKCAAPKGRKE